MDAARNVNLWQVVGMGLCFAWVFLAQPTVDASAGIQMGSQYPQSSIIRLATVGFVFYALLPLLPKALSQEMHTKTVSVGLVLRLGGFALSSYALFLADSSLLLFVGDFLAGGGVAVFLIAWGLILIDQDKDQGEMAFIFSFVVSGFVVGMVGMTPDSFQAVVLVFLPTIEFACMMIGGVPDGMFFEMKSQGGLSVISASLSAMSHETKGKFFGVFARVFLAITLVSFVWEMFSESAQGAEFPKLAVFGVGLATSALVIFLFTRYSSSTGFVAAARWVLPIMAVGLFFSALGGLAALVFACLFLATAHASFETILRMWIIDFARRHKSVSLGIVGWGFAAISLGAFFGTALFRLLFAGVESIDRMHIVGILTVLVVVSAFLFSNQLPNPEGSDHPDDITVRCGKMSEKYGLSVRETEILGYLLEGRSHPYIRDELYISKSTADTHVRHIYAKVGVRSKQELIDVSKQ